MDLGGVEIDGHDAVDAGGGDKMGHQGGGDRCPWLGLAVLPGVTEVGDDQVDFLGGCPAAGVGEDKNLHEVVINGRAGGLDDEDHLAADRFDGLAKDFPRRETLDDVFRDFHAEALGDVGGELFIG